jgi:cytochrome c oxidase assembly protein subunit 15
MKYSRELPKWFLPVLNGLVIEVFLLICLGGSVRLMNAGLACPDWPLCFGDFIPDYHPQVYLEFIHRAMAGIVSITTGVLIVFMFRARNVPLSVKRTALFAIVLLLTQIVFGGLTVLLALRANVVAAHLTMGVGFFLLLLWIYLTLKRRAEAGLLGPAYAHLAVGDALAPAPVKSVTGSGVSSAGESDFGTRAVPLAQVVPSKIKRWCIFLFCAVYGQLILGGLVASNYASLACIDFPKCQGEWIPTLSGVVGLHVIHRFGAYTVLALILANFFSVRRSSEANARMKKLAGLMLMFVLMQVCIGIANVLLLAPPLIAVAHLGVGTATLSVALRQLHAAYFG